MWRAGGKESTYLHQTAPQIGTMPKAGIRFGGNAYCKRLLADERGKLTMARQFLAGVVRGNPGGGSTL